jgi:geranylgeranyl pyrophosphate synthase
MIENHNRLILITGVLSKKRIWRISLREQLRLLEFKLKFKCYSEQKILKLENSLAKPKNSQNVASLKVLASAVTHILKGESSLTRPLLVFSSCYCFSLTEQTALEIAFCIELIHSMSLIIDDLPSMDNADMRRGRPTVHKAYREGQAILAAFSLYTYAFKMFSTIDTIDYNNLKKATHLLFKYLLNVIKGQAIDISLPLAQANTTKVDEMHILKTGFLIRACIVVPALLSTAKKKSPKVISALEVIADAFGLAYQIRDDLLDALSDPIELGKSSNLDEIQQKPSYVRLLGVERSMRKLIESFTCIFQSLQVIQIVDKNCDVALLTLLIEQMWIKSVELKTFLPSQSEKLKQHAELLANGLKSIGRTNQPTSHYIFYYAHGVCFPLYSPRFFDFMSSNNHFYEQVESKLIDFIQTHKLHLLFAQKMCCSSAESLTLIDTHATLADIYLKKLQAKKLGTLISLMATTSTFIKNPIRLQFLADFTAYINWLADLSMIMTDEEWTKNSQKVLMYLRLEIPSSHDIPPEYQVAIALGLRLRIITRHIYGEKLTYEVCIQNFLSSVSKQLKVIPETKYFHHATISYEEWNKHRQNLLGHLPIIRLIYLLLGAPFNCHLTITIKQLEEIVLCAITKINDFMSLRADLLKAEFNFSIINQLYTSDQLLKADPKFPANLAVLRAIKEKCSLKQAIFRELIDYAQMIDLINNWVKRHIKLCTPVEAEALEIHQRWSSFASPLWLLMNEHYSGNHDLVHHQFRAWCSKTSSVKKESQLSNINHRLKTLFWNWPSDSSSIASINESTCNIKSKL